MGKKKLTQEQAMVCTFFSDIPDIILYKHSMRIFGFTLFSWGKYTMSLKEVQDNINKNMNALLDSRKLKSIWN